MFKVVSLVLLLGLLVSEGMAVTFLGNIHGVATKSFKNTNLQNNINPTPQNDPDLFLNANLNMNL